MNDTRPRNHRCHKGTRMTATSVFHPNRVTPSARTCETWQHQQRRIAEPNPSLRLPADKCARPTGSNRACADCYGVTGHHAWSTTAAIRRVSLYDIGYPWRCRGSRPGRVVPRLAAMPAARAPPINTKRHTHWKFPAPPPPAVSLLATCRSTRSAAPRRQPTPDPPSSATFPTPGRRPFATTTDLATANGV